MKVTALPRLQASSFAAFLGIACRSAISSASPYLILFSSSQGAELRHPDEIALPLRPARPLVAAPTLNIDVIGHEIVAATRLIVGTVDEILGMDALPHLSPLHVGNSGNHRLARAVSDFLLEL